MAFNIDPLEVKMQAQKVSVKAEENIRTCHLDDGEGIFKTEGLVDQEPIENF